MGLLKKTYTCLVVILLFLSLHLQVYACETVLTIVVPSKVTLTLEIIGFGKIGYLGDNYSHSTTIQLPLNTDAVFSFSPGKRYQIESVTYNGKSQSKFLVNNTLTLSNVESDSVLRVVFSQYGDNPFTGDSFPLMWHTVITLLSLIGIIIFVIKLRKQ